MGDEGFSSSPKSTIHINLCTGDEPFRWILFYKRVCILYSLGELRMGQPGDKPFSCPVCERRFPACPGLSYTWLCTAKTNNSNVPYVARDFQGHPILKITWAPTPKKKRLNAKCVRRNLHNFAGSATYDDPTLMRNHLNVQCVRKDLQNRHGLRYIWWATQEKKTLSCSLCENRFPTRSSLKEHMVVHAGEKTFKC